MKRLFLAFSLFCFAAACVFADGADKASLDKALFARWNAALLSGDASKVADNYAPDAILVPTVSNKVRHTRAEIVDYFKHFLELSPKAVVLEANVRSYGDIMIDSGVYAFSVRKGGKDETVVARFTFVYKKGPDGVWRIVEHHSSAMPEPGKAP
jgi:uncharacterized protein (TIGR02246 family)